VATAFFLQLGLAAALGGSVLLSRDARSAEAPRSAQASRSVQAPPSWSASLQASVIIGTIAFAVLPAWTLEKPLVPVHLEEVDGMYYGDEGTAEGVPFHWTREYGTVFVPAAVRTVDIPLRSPIAAVTKQPTLVEIRSGGRTVVENVLVGEHWQDVRINLPSPEPPLQISRISLRSNQTARAAELIPGSSDERVVGVQVGDYKIIRSSWEFVPKPASAQAPP